MIQADAGPYPAAAGLFSPTFSDEKCMSIFKWVINAYLDDMRAALKLWREWYVELRRPGRIVALALRVVLAAWGMMAAITLSHFVFLRLPLALTLAGVACNLVAVLSNDGRMPVRWRWLNNRFRRETRVKADYLVRTQIILVPRGRKLKGKPLFDERHQLMTPDTKLKFLCDLHRAVGCVWSLGDLLMFFSSVVGLACGWILDGKVFEGLERPKISSPRG